VHWWPVAVAAAHWWGGMVDDDVLVEVGAFLFSLLLMNPFLLGGEGKTNVFSRT
jgi:hypothetical protein